LKKEKKEKRRVGQGKSSILGIGGVKKKMSGELLIINQIEQTKRKKCIYRLDSSLFCLRMMNIL